MSIAKPPKEVTVSAADEYLERNVVTSSSMKTLRVKAKIQPFVNATFHFVISIIFRFTEVEDHCYD